MYFKHRSYGRLTYQTKLKCDMMGTTAPVSYQLAQDVVLLLIYYHGWWGIFRRLAFSLS